MVAQAGKALETHCEWYAAWRDDCGERQINVDSEQKTREVTNAVRQFLNRVSPKRVIYEKGYSDMFSQKFLK